MDKKDFIGREQEVDIIEKYYNSSKSEMVAVYGRRRVGKTYLIKKTIGKKFDFEFVGSHKTPAKVQREQFQNEINKWSHSTGNIPKDWFAAFSNLKDYLLSLNKKRVVVFLDELPWMDTVNSNFLSAFSYFWNTWDSTKTLLKLYVCG